MTVKPARRTQKSPRWAGRFGKLGASTRSAVNTLAGDFRNLVIEEPKMQPIYCGTPSRVRATPAVRPLAFRLGGAA